MFKIRRVYDDVIPLNRGAVEQVRNILAAQFDELPPREVQGLTDKLRNPLKHGFRSVLMVAEKRRHEVVGFALLFHEPELHFLYLDYIAVATGKTSGGVGGALYETVRDEALALGCKAAFFECLPDDHPGISEEKRKENADRLRFYERYGARPIAGTRYDLPVDARDSSPQPCLVVDLLDKEVALSRSWARRVVRTILERKYAELCPLPYVEEVVASFKEDPVRLRGFRYRRPASVHRRAAPRKELVSLFVNDRHEIHHVRERGYVEAPVRIGRILEALEPSGWFERKQPAELGMPYIRAVHSPELVSYLKKACEGVGPGKTLYPYVFPLRNKARLPRERSVLAGYYCIDTFTPIHSNAFKAAARAVDCTIAAAEEIRTGRRIAYSLVRPPGHHAERSCFGGFCYFNNAAAAAHFLSREGKVAILDIDYHHGNGQQDIFYSRSDVLTVSLHGHPKFAYPYFTGFEDETGSGPGEGFNWNLPLPESLDGSGYRRSLRRARERIEQFEPAFLVVALGYDPARGDPTGTWRLNAEDFRRNGQIIGELGLPTLVVQEGGYRTRSLGKNALAFFQGLLDALPR